MRTSRRVTHRIDFPREIEIILKPLVERLLADDDDGHALQTALRPFFLGTRPCIEILRGAETITYIEGPRYEVAGETFPLGSRVFTEVGWVSLDPIQTSELQQRLRVEIDRTVFRFLAETRTLERASPYCPQPNRSTDDAQAIASMIAWASRTAPSETTDAQ
jgi:hypothetical protein